MAARIRLVLALMVVGWLSGAGCQDEQAARRAAAGQALQRATAALHQVTSGTLPPAADRQAVLAAAAADLQKAVADGAGAQRLAAHRLLATVEGMAAASALAQAEGHGRRIAAETASFLSRMVDLIAAEGRAAQLQVDRTAAISGTRLAAQTYAQAAGSAAAQVTPAEQSVRELQAEQARLVAERDRLMARSSAQMSQAFAQTGAPQYDLAAQAIQTERQADALDAKAETLQVRLRLGEADLNLAKVREGSAADASKAVAADVAAMEEADRKGRAAAQKALSDAGDAASVAATANALAEHLDQILLVASKEMEPEYARAMEALDKALAQVRSAAPLAWDSTDRAAVTLQSAEVQVARTRALASRLASRAAVARLAGIVANHARNTAALAARAADLAQRQASLKQLAQDDAAAVAGAVKDAREATEAIVSPRADSAQTRIKQSYEDQIAFCQEWAAASLADSAPAAPRSSSPRPTPRPASPVRGGARPAAPAPGSPQAALQAFAQAIMARDKAALTAAIDQSTEEGKSATRIYLAAVDLMAAQDTLVAAVTAKFGAPAAAAFASQSKEGPASMADELQRASEQIGSARVQVNGDKAVVTFEGNPMGLVRRDGKWLYDATVAAPPPQAGDMLVKILEAMSRVMESTAATAPQAGSVEQLRARFQQQMQTEVAPLLVQFMGAMMGGAMPPGGGPGPGAGGEPMK